MHQIEKNNGQKLSEPSSRIINQKADAPVQNYGQINVPHAKNQQKIKRRDSTASIKKAGQINHHTNNVTHTGENLKNDASVPTSDSKPQ